MNIRQAMLEMDRRSRQQATLVQGMLIWWWFNVTHSTTAATLDIEFDEDNESVVFSATKEE